jgi:hypothetical protein
VTPSRTEILKGKIKLSLCLINYASHHEDVWGSGSIAPPFFISALDKANGKFYDPAALPPGKALLMLIE